MVDIQLSSQPLSVQEAQLWQGSEGIGGSCMFIGTVRNETRGKMVLSLEFEAYEPMAISEMQKIGDEAMRRWEVDRVLIHHRTGKLSPGEIPVIIVVAAAHRDAAFAACRYCIDTLKETVPIWKKEIFEDGEEWVAAHP